jgi:ribosomal protein S17E
MGNIRNAYTILVGKSLGKKPYGRLKRRYENNTQ